MSFSACLFKDPPALIGQLSQAWEGSPTTTTTTSPDNHSDFYPVLCPHLLQRRDLTALSGDDQSEQLKNIKSARLFKRPGRRGAAVVNLRANL